MIMQFAVKDNPVGTHSEAAERGVYAASMSITGGSSKLQSKPQTFRAVKRRKRRAPSLHKLKMKPAARLPERPIDKDISAIKRAMGFKRATGKCATCKFFTRMPVGTLNRCGLGDFPCSAKHGCKAYSKGEPMFNGNHVQHRVRDILKAIEERR
jgi:hypothetical protein